MRLKDDLILDDVLQQMVSMRKGGLRDTLLRLRNVSCNTELTVCYFQNKRVILSTVTEDNIDHIQKTAATVKDLGKKRISINQVKNILIKKENRIYIRPGVCMVTIFPIFYGDELCYFLIAESYENQPDTRGWHADDRLLKLLGVEIRLHCLETAGEQVMDRLTTLPVRDSLIQFINSIDRTSMELSLHFFIIQLNNLQELNDEYGYKFGDETLKKIAFCLKKFFLVNIYRISGKRFLLIRQGNVYDIRLLLEDALALLRKLDARFAFSAVITPIYDNPFHSLSVCERSIKRTDIEPAIIIREFDTGIESDSFMVPYTMKEQTGEITEEKNNGDNRDNLSFEEEWNKLLTSF